MKSSTADQRKTKLADWASQQISQQKLASGQSQLSVVSGDASFRRYFRLSYPVAQTSQSKLNDNFILVDAPPDHENCAAFVSVGELFRGAGMSTPKVLAVDFDQGFMLLEDFGNNLYLPQLQKALASDAPEAVLNEAEHLYELAIKALIRLQKNARTHKLASYDRALLHREMALFEEWFCGRLLQQQMNEADREIIATTLQFLEDEALAQPVVAVHRDYHARNLMIPETDQGRKDGIPAVIDFQDAVAGPYTYDLISLLRDCYIKWPAEKVYSRAMTYFRLAKAQAIIADDIDVATFRRHLDLMGLQRHLKVLGIFSRLSIRDNKPQYLGDLPIVIDYTLEVVDQYPELGDFAAWFKTKLLPVAREKLAAQTISSSGVF